MGSGRGRKHTQGRLPRSHTVGFYLRSTLGEQGSQPYVNKRPPLGVPSTPPLAQVFTDMPVSFTIFMIFALSM